MEMIQQALSSPITLGILVLSGIILFILTAREITTWFLKLNHIEKEFSRIHVSLERIEEKIGDIENLARTGSLSTADLKARANAALPDDSAMSPSVAEPLESEKSRSFPLQH